ncbi:MAG: hypothetical protein ABJB66_12055 [Gemmatimonadaceae bacterium]
MSWTGTIITAIITAAIGAMASVYVADQAVRWYRISSFEGGSSYWVVMMGFLALIVGLILGLIVSRVVAAGNAPSILKALGSSVFLMLALVGIVGVTGRLMADVPPTIDGENLMLMVESRWPSTRVESPANAPGISYLKLGSNTRGNVERISKRGALWKEDAIKIDGMWTVTGAVEIFTERGIPSLDIALNDKEHNGFIIQLPSRPSKKDFEWTDWYPKDGKDGPTRTKGVTYRTRVQKGSLPIRTERVGLFEVDATASGYMYDPADGTSTLDPNASFHIRYNGKPVAYALDSAQNVTTDVGVGMIAQLSRPQTTLMLLVNSSEGASHCALLIDDNGTLRQQRVADSCSAEELSPNAIGIRISDSRRLPKGRVDRQTFANSTTLLFKGAVLDVGPLTVRPYTAKSDASAIQVVPPIGFSPDGGSFVRFMLDYQSATNSSLPIFVVTNVANNTVTSLPINRARMHYSEFVQLTPEWLLHHFKWEHDRSGKDILVERANFIPLPYSGTIDIDTMGRPTYRIPEGGQVIRMALIGMLIAEFKAQRDSVAEDDYTYPIHIAGRKLAVSSTGGTEYVMVTMSDEGPSTDLIARIGKAFNAELATGKYDSSFGKTH